MLRGKIACICIIEDLNMQSDIINWAYMITWLRSLPYMRIYFLTLESQLHSVGKQNCLRDYYLSNSLKDILPLVFLSL